MIKAFAVRSVQDLEKAQKCTADHILLDQGKGSGTTFDWSLVAENRDRITRPFFLAGGLDAGICMRHAALGAGSQQQRGDRQDQRQRKDNAGDAYSTQPVIYRRQEVIYDQG